MAREMREEAPPGAEVAMINGFPYYTKIKVDKPPSDDESVDNLVDGLSKQDSKVAVVDAPSVVVMKEPMRDDDVNEDSQFKHDLNMIVGLSK